MATATSAFVMVPFADRVIFAVGGRVEDAVAEWDWNETLNRFHEEQIRNLPMTIASALPGIGSQFIPQRQVGRGDSFSNFGGSMAHQSTLSIERERERPKHTYREIVTINGGHEGRF